MPDMNVLPIGSISRKLSFRSFKVKQQTRYGAAAVEFAMTAPILFLLVSASLEFGRASYVQNSLTFAAMIGCRTAILPGTNPKLVEQTVARALTASGITKYQVTMTPSDVGTSNQEQIWQLVTVKVTAKFSDVSWLPIPRFLGIRQLSGTCSLPSEVPR